MLVQDSMTKDPITAPPTVSVRRAWELMIERAIQHLPIVDQGSLVGIVTDRDLRLVMPSPATTLEAHELTSLLDAFPVAEVMTPKPVTVSPSMPLEDATRLLMRFGLGAAAVLQEGRLVGILTRSDVLEAFLSPAGQKTAALAA